VRFSFFDSIITQLVLAVVFAVLSVSSYLRLYPDKNPITINLKELPGSYSLRYQKNCFGTIQISTELTDELTTIQAEGELRFKQAGNTQQAKVQGEVNFNILGQFGNAITTFTLGDNILRVGALGINPIEIVIRSSQNNKNTFQREFEIEGPIQGKRINSHFLAIEYKHLNPETRSLPNLGFTIEKLDVRNNCEGDVLDIENFSKTILS